MNLFETAKTVVVDNYPTVKVTDAENPDQEIEYTGDFGGWIGPLRLINDRIIGSDGRQERVTITIGRRGSEEQIPHREVTAASELMEQIKHLIHEARTRQQRFGY